MKSPARDEERIERLMMAALDDELDDGERAELEQRLEDDPARRAEWKRLQHVKEMTRMTRIEHPPDEQWDTYWHSVYNRLERGIGWILVSLGAIVLLSHGLWQAVENLLADTDMPGFVKLAIFGLGTGGIVLLVSIVREKLFTRRHDPYKEVER